MGRGEKFSGESFSPLPNPRQRGPPPSLQRLLCLSNPCSQPSLEAGYLYYSDASFEVHPAGCGIRAGGKSLPTVDASSHTFRRKKHEQPLSLPAFGRRLPERTGNAAPVLYATTPRPLLRSLTNAFLDGCRRDIKEGRLTDSGQLGLDALLPRLAAFAEKEAAPRFRRVLNATGVVIHTNMAAPSSRTRP